MSRYQRLAEVIIRRWLPPEPMAPNAADGVASSRPGMSDRESMLETAVLVLEGADLFTAVRELFWLVALGLQLRGRRATGDRPIRILRKGASIGIIVAAALTVGLAAGLPPTAVRVSAIAVSVLLLTAGWHDPRLAVATIAVWVWRLAEADHAAFVEDLGRLGAELSVTGLVMRWTFMAATVIGAIAFSKASIDRATRL